MNSLPFVKLLIKNAKVPGKSQSSSSWQELSVTSQKAAVCSPCTWDCAGWEWNAAVRERASCSLLCSVPHTLTSGRVVHSSLKHMSNGLGGAGGAASYEEFLCLKTLWFATPCWLACGRWGAAGGGPSRRWTCGGQPTSSSSRGGGTPGGWVRNTNLADL